MPSLVEMTVCQFTSLHCAVRRPPALPTRSSCALAQALGANEPSLLAVLVVVPVVIGILFVGWQDYQDDEDDFFDTYDSRRFDRDLTNRNRLPVGEDSTGRTNRMF